MILDISILLSCYPVADIGVVASGAGPCLLIPRHQCRSKCLEAYGFDQ